MRLIKRTAVTSASKTVLTSEESSLLSLPPVRRALSTKRSKERAYGKQKQKTAVSFCVCPFNLSSFLLGRSVLLVLSILSSLSSSPHGRDTQSVASFLPSLLPFVRSRLCVSVCADFVFYLFNLLLLFLSLYVNFIVRGERTVESPLFSLLSLPP